MQGRPGSIQCKTHARGMPVAPQMCVMVEGLHAPEVQRLKELCIEICIQNRNLQDNEKLEPLIYLGIPQKKGCEIRLTNKKLFISIAKNTNNKIWN